MNFVKQSYPQPLLKLNRLIKESILKAKLIKFQILSLHHFTIIYALKVMFTLFVRQKYETMVCYYVSLHSAIILVT